MDFTISEDRQLLAETLARFLAAAWDPETRATAAYEHPYHSPATWDDLVELGVLGALVGPDADGFGGTGLDIMVMFEQVGATLAPEPLLGTLLALRLLEVVGADDLLRALLGGEARAVVATTEPHDPDTTTDLRTHASPNGGDWSLTGRKSMVYGAPGADLALVTALHDDIVGVWAVELADAATSDYALIDGGGASEVVLEATPATLVASDAAGPVEAALDAGRLALCAEAVGAMQRLFDLTTVHLRSRTQFGRPLAAFQALQHRVVDLAIELEQARSITILAADALDGPQRSLRVAQAKHLVGRVAHLVAEEAVQLHGGIGMTWEYPGAHLAKRLVMIDHQLGDGDLHLRRIVDGRAG